MKHAWLLLLLLTACPHSPAPPKAAESQTVEPVACPKITASTPWNLDARRGVDSWTCSYSYAVTDKPLLEATISNHVGKPPLELYTFYPEGSDSLWFREIPDSPTKVRTYWSFRPTGSRPMSILAISFTAVDSSEFKAKALIADSLEP